MTEDPQVTLVSNVFVSYASQDMAVANAIVAALEGHGIKCWIAPRDVRPGTVYADAIVGAINEAKALVLVLSANAMPSAHVGREVERAASKRKQVIAFRIDATPLSRALEYFLSDSQWIDVPKLAMPAALNALTAAVRQAPATSQPVAVGGRARGSKRVVAIAAAIVGMCVAVGGAVYFWSRSHSSVLSSGGVAPPRTLGTPEAGVAVSDKSIAVLPFADMSQKHDQEYFGDGMAEEILDLLAKVPGLHVPARTSSFYFKGKTEDIPTIARRLMVAHILEGSVRKSGNHVRVTVQLVRADNGYHLWSETYDRTLDDLFKVQDEIAGEVVKALKVSMHTSGAAPRAAPTKSAEAQNLRLQADFWYFRGTDDGMKKAARYFQQAVDLDPDFAYAWASLSESLVNIGPQAGQDWHQVRELALHAAERAVALDPKLASAHLALGMVYHFADWNWAAADKEYETALSLDPGNTYALHLVGLLTAAHGRLADAIHLWEQSAARDPLNYFAYSAVSYGYYAMGRFPEALAAMRKTLELVPTAEYGHASLAQMLLAAGQKDEALAEARRESDASARAYALAWIYIKIGRRSDAVAALAEFQEHSSAEFPYPYAIAILHALRGDRDQAFLWLNRAYQQHDESLIGSPPITVDPDMKNLHADPRWAAFLRKMKLP